VPARDPTVILNAVVADEPDGYRGRRRRFLLGRKRGSALLPGLLVAASVVVVLIVVGVSQLLPRGANGQIPLGGGPNNGATTGDNGQPLAGSSGPGSPGQSAKPSRSAGAKPSASPSGGVSPAPVPPGALPPIPAPASSSPSSLTPVSVEAERATLGGTAKVSTCGTCSGGTKVRNVGGNAGWVTVSVPNVPRAGTYQMTITYELGEPSRTFYLSINGGAGIPVTVTSNITDWSTPLSATVQVTLTLAGTNTVKFYNPTTAYAPDLDKVAVR
jgi:Carbohydrate binding module (family 35)